MATDNPQGIGLNAAQEQIAKLMEPDGQPDVGDDAGEEPELEEGEPEGELEPEDALEENDEGDEEPRYTVKVDGEEIEVTQSELIAGYSKEADYRRKTTALAEERKQIEAEREKVKEVQTERAQYATLLTALKDSLEAPPEEPDWDAVYAADPNRFPLIKHKWDTQEKARQSQLAAINSEQQRVAAAARADYERQQKAEIAAEEAKIPDIIPEWKDAKRRDAEWTAIKAHYGDDVESVTTAKGKEILRKAWLFDQGKAKATLKTSPTMQPGAQGRRVSDLTKQSERLAKTGRVADAASIIAKLI